MNGSYYILRHKQTSKQGHFWIAAKQTYKVFSWSSWLNPFYHIVPDDYTKQHTTTWFFEAKYAERRWKVNRVNNIGDEDDYMSIIYEK